MSLIGFNLSGILAFTVSPLELIVRGALMYWFLFIVFRFVPRRDVGALGLGDFLFVEILGDAAQNSMIGGATSAVDGMVLISSLIFWSYLLDVMSFRFSLVRRFTEAPRLCLVRDGKLQRKNMRLESITVEELHAKIRQNGIEDIAMVKLMFLEADGEISLICQDGARSVGADAGTGSPSGLPVGARLRGDAGAGGGWPRRRIPVDLRHTEALGRQLAL
jgi:uncharacterized membrane protein YcaP (DUF421 family)